MNNAIKTDKGHHKDVYAVYDRWIDHYKTFAIRPTQNPIPLPLPLTRKEMNYMLIRSTIYNIPARVTHT